MATKKTKKTIEISKEFKKSEFKPEIEKPKEEKKIKEISYITKKVFKDYILTTIYYKDGTVEERKSTDIRRA